MEINSCNRNDLGVIIVAGGSGSRMGADVPKQFLKIMHIYILECTLKVFLPIAKEIVVVLPRDQHQRWAQIVAEKGLEGTHKVCSGGATRFESVQCGLATLSEECSLVAVHDGVRSLVSRQMVLRGIATALQHGSAIPTVGAVDSFRVECEGALRVIDRSTLRAIQTPQIFSSELLRRAYNTEPSPAFTDDGTVVERLGVELAYYEGERSNIKITTPEDLIIAEAFLALSEQGQENCK